LSRSPGGDNYELISNRNFLKDSVLGKVEQVCSCSLIDDPMACLVTMDRVAMAGILEGMPDERRLPMIESVK
jgi:hypothetical protein